MNTDDAKTMLKKIMIDELFIEIPEAKIKDDDAIGTDLGLDSVGYVELATILRERLGVPIKESDVTSGAFATIGSLAEFIVSSSEMKCPT